MTYQLIHGDCLDVEWPQVDAIITDVPYGVTACKWDSIIPFEPMWAKIKSSLKSRGAFVTTASQPFTSALVMSNPKWFRYCNYWIKSPVGFLNSKKMPLLNVEDILIFCSGMTTYNPQGLVSVNIKKKNGKSKSERGKKGLSTHNGGRLVGEFTQEFTNYPRQTIQISNEKGLHPTQKPVALYEYLIKTYTNEGDTVLDFCMGSGTTGVACINTGRNFIGIEKDEKYYNIAKERLGL